MLDGGPNATYKWDAADRLRAINIGSHRTEIQYDGLGRRAHVTEKEASTVTSEKRFLWSGNELSEERDAAGGTVTKRFFGQGEQRIAGSDAGVYFYTRDHLGSIRELTDSSGTVRARYDYDVWGQRSKVVGDLDTYFGFTGFYFHNQSGLNFSRTRAYDCVMGQWINRDPMRESGGSNLSDYAGNNPIRNIDPLGLSWVDTISHFDLYSVLNNAAANSYGYEGFWGNAGGIAANLGTTLLDVLGGEQVLDAASRSGAAQGCGNYRDAWLNGAEAVILIGIAAIPGGAEEAAVVRTEARNLTEQLVLKEAEAGAGTRIMEGRVRDPNFPEELWAKMSHTHDSPGGAITEIHYWLELASGSRTGFKFK